ncbi:MAG: asparagine synthase (glutamine-hydrolyzing) [bacterium]|nr:asparagine synthase (glutamine-hydrolyzing) [bacterium]
MCGICGMVGFANPDLLKKMCRIMSHRGPDDEGYFIDKNIGLGIGRLSIIDLETGHQPIHNEDETIWIVFNGEIYNFQELRESLKKKGHQFYTKTDTEVIIHLYEEKGKDCVNYLNGMFAFAIWDKNDEKLFLARDRLGIKPLYYTVVDGNLLFASEIKALLECDKVKKEVNLIGMHHFLTFLYVPAPFSMFKGIKKLPPAHTMSYKNGNLEVTQYWDLYFSKAKTEREEYYSERILELLREAIKIRLVSDVP